MSRTGVLSFVALATVTALAVTACSSGDVPVGSTASSQNDLKKKADGTPTGDGTTCSWDGVTSYDPSTGVTTSVPGPGMYKLGDTFKSLDGCNDCSCTAQGIACTQLACAPADGGTGASCTYNGKSYPNGASFKSTDGCNGCSCNDGEVGCTDVACAPAPAACKKTGCSSEICADHDEASPCVFSPTYACYQKASTICEVQPNGQCGFTPSTALTQCLAGK